MHIILVARIISDGNDPRDGETDYTIYSFSGTQEMEQELEELKVNFEGIPDVQIRYLTSQEVEAGGLNGIKMHEV